MYRLWNLRQGAALVKVACTAIILQITKSASNLQKCPFDAIMIINLPKNLEKETTHRYGPNTFKLHRYAAINDQLELIFQQILYELYVRQC